MLRVKANTGGLSTDKFEGCNCTIQTAPSLTLENHKVIASIGKETMIPFGNYSFGFDDFQNTLFEKEEFTKILLRD
jgi:hypothetical protein